MASRLAAKPNKGEGFGSPLSSMFKLSEIETLKQHRVVRVDRIMSDGQQAMKVVALGGDRSEQAACLIQAKRDLRQFTDSTWRNL